MREGFPALAKFRESFQSYMIKSLPPRQEAKGMCVSPSATLFLGDLEKAP